MTTTNFFTIWITVNIRRIDMKFQQHCPILFNTSTNVVLERLDFSSVYFYCKNIFFSIPDDIKFFLVTTSRESENARAYGRYQNVFLTDEELADLQASFPTVWGQYIEKLSEYMASTGKRYQSHAATIRRWAGEDAKKAVPPTRNRDYSVKEDETV